MRFLLTALQNLSIFCASWIASPIGENGTHTIYWQEANHGNEQHLSAEYTPLSLTTGSEYLKTVKSIIPNESDNTFHVPFLRWSTERMDVW